MKLKNITVQVGGFHDHWLRNSTDTSGLLTAIASRFHYDFICLMDHEYYNQALEIRRQVENWIPGFKVHIGHERMYDWGHLVTVENEDAEYDTTNTDFYGELARMRKAPGIVALGHIMHPSSATVIVESGEMDKLLDEGYIDAIQIEKDADMEKVKCRLDAGKKTAIISGFDSHQLVVVNDLPNCVYNDRYQLLKHIDCQPKKALRTIVIAEDNSWQSIQKALKEGKSVVENFATKTLHGSPELVKLITENGYFEKMEELDRPYDEILMEREPLVCGEDAVLKFPVCGKVWLPVNANLDINVLPTNDKGEVVFKNVPMPCDHDDSFLPVKIESDKGTRVWAIKVDNDIHIEPIPYYTDEKKTLILKAKRDFEGEIKFIKPYTATYNVNAKKDQDVLVFDLKDQDKHFFEYEFTAKNVKGRERTYKGKVALIKATRYDPEWKNCDVVTVDREEFSVHGYGTKRTYPGKDVFSYKTMLQWDEENLYVKYDIIDKNFFPSDPKKKYYESDSQSIKIDPNMSRTKIKDPNDGTLTLYTVMYEGKPAFACEIRDWIFGGDQGTELKYEFNDKGRVVTFKYPWKLITNRKIEKGITMGVEISVVNCEACGLIDNTNWPSPPVAAFLFPFEWGVFGLL